MSTMYKTRFIVEMLPTKFSGPFELFLIQASAPQLVSTILSVGSCIYITEPLQLIEKNSPCSGSHGFLLRLSERCFTICSTPYNHK